MPAKRVGQRSQGVAKHRAMTLIELLTVFSIISLLVAILLPGLSQARQQAQATVCRSNIRQIAMANDLYAHESEGVYCAGAPDMLRNLQRWHGQRNAVNEAFDSARGPLVPYLGPGGEIRRCPSFEPDHAGFEAGNGGYGYNNAYIGVQIEAPQPGGFVNINDRSGAVAGHVARPGNTVMFTDAAFVSGGLIEYSFAEPRFHVQFGFRADPSVHFRHRHLANVAWCDGHVTQEARTFSWSSGFYQGDPDNFDVGWFGRTDDNALFDLD